MKYVAVRGNIEWDACAIRPVDAAVKTLELHVLHVAVAEVEA